MALRRTHLRPALSASMALGMLLLTLNPALAGPSLLPEARPVVTTLAATADPVACTVAHATLDAACERWAAFFEGSGGSATKVAARGAIAVVTGSVSTARNGTDILTAAYDLFSGRQLWSATYDGPLHSDDTAGGLAIGPDGLTAYVAGRSWGTSSRNDYVALAYRTLDGDLSWSARHAALGSVHYWGSSTMNLALSPDGSRVYVGDSKVLFGGAGIHPVTVAFHASNGTLAWQAVAPNGEAARELLASPDGSKVFVVAGYPSYIIAYDAATGAQRWSANWASSIVPTLMATDSSGTRLYVTGVVSPGIRIGTVAYNTSSGAQLWSALAGDPVQWTVGYSIGVSPDDATVVVAGYSGANAVLHPTGASDIVAAAHRASSGTKLWERTYGGPGGGLDAPALGEAVRFSSCGGDRAFLAATVTTQGGTPRIALLSYNLANGTLASLALHAGPGSAHGFTESPVTGDFLVAGRTMGNVTTVAFGTGLLHSVGPLPPPLAPQPCPLLATVAAV